MMPDATFAIDSATLAMRERVSHKKEANHGSTQDSSTFAKHRNAPQTQHDCTQERRAKIHRTPEIDAHDFATWHHYGTQENRPSRECQHAGT
jgi:hypothetical protein